MGKFKFGLFGAALCVLAAGGCSPGQEAGNQTAETAPGKVQAAAPAAALTPLTPISNKRCSTQAPQGWWIADQNEDGTVFTLNSADGSQVASYGGVAIGSGQAEGRYGEEYRSPRALTLYAATQLARETMEPSGPSEQVGPYEAIPLKGLRHSGWAMIYRFAVPDPGGYGVIMRIAIGGQDAKSVGIAGGVAAATVCQSVTHPSTGPVYRAPRETRGAGSSASGGSDVTLAGTYNAQLGTGWAHDSLGRNYNVDVAGDWRENGPDGPGFYGSVGGRQEKLTPGMN